MNDNAALSPRPSLSKRRHLFSFGSASLTRMGVEKTTAGNAVRPTHRQDRQVNAQVQHVHHERRGELQLRAVREEHERRPERELEDLQ